MQKVNFTLQSKNITFAIMITLEQLNNEDFVNAIPAKIRIEMRANLVVDQIIRNINELRYEYDSTGHIVPAEQNIEAWFDGEAKLNKTLHSTFDEIFHSIKEYIEKGEQITEKEFYDWFLSYLADYLSALLLNEQQIYFPSFEGV